MNFEFLAPAKPDPGMRGETIRTAMSRKPVGICVWTAAAQAKAMLPGADRDAPDALVQVINECVPRLAVLITMGDELPQSRAVAHIGVSLPQAAELLGKKLPEILGDKHSYLLLHEDGKDKTASDCYARFKLAASQFSELTLLDEVDSWKSGRTDDVEILAMLDRFQHAGLMVTLNPQAWLTRNPKFRLGENKRMATLTAPPDLWPRVRSGEAAALVGTLDGDIGFQALETAWQVLTGGFEPSHPRGVACELITAETLDDFANRYAQAGGLDRSALP